MKNFLIIVFGLLTFIQYSNAQGFEGGRMSPSFMARFDKVSEESIVGKLMAVTDYNPNTAFQSPEKLSLEKGLAYTFWLMRNPTIFELRRDKPNFIYVTTGIISIIYRPNKEWYINYTDYVSNIHRSTNLGCRVYTLVDKK